MSFKVKEREKEEKLFNEKQNLEKKDEGLRKSVLRNVAGLIHVFISM